MAKHYTDAERAEALAVLQANGGNMLRTSKATGIPRTTLITWSGDVERQERTADVGERKRLNLAEVIRAELDAIFQAMASKRTEATYRELATAAGILIDKLGMLHSHAPNIVQPIVEGDEHDGPADWRQRAAAEGITEEEVFADVERVIAEERAKKLRLMAPTGGSE